MKHPMQEALDLAIQSVKNLNLIADELAELRAYRDRTEAALRDLCARGKDCVPNEDFVTPWDLESRGLWREGGA